jgi:hypothetical protein
VLGALHAITSEVITVTNWVCLSKGGRPGDDITTR